MMEYEVYMFGVDKEGARGLYLSIESARNWAKSYLKAVIRDVDNTGFYILNSDTKEVLETHNILREDIPEMNRRIKIIKGNNSIIEEEFNRFDIMILD